MSLIPSRILLLLRAALALLGSGGTITPPPPPPPPPVGSYADAYRYAPRVDLPNFVTYDSTTGGFVGLTPLWSQVPGEPAPGVASALRKWDLTNISTVVRLTDAGNRPTNETALQAAVDAALNRNTHTIIFRTPGVDWGRLTFRARTGTGRIIIADNRLDPQNVLGVYPLDMRATCSTTQAESFALSYVYSDNDPQVIIENGAQYYSIFGADLTYAPNYAPGTAEDLAGGTTNTSGLVNCPFWADPNNLPNNIVLTHVAVHGRPFQALKKGIRWAGSKMVQRGCQVYDIGIKTQDSQGVNVNDGAGPYLFAYCSFVTNYGESVMLGGGDDNLLGAAYQVQDVVFYRCTFTQQPSWHTYSPLTKNLFESKWSNRVLHWQCTYGPYWGNGQWGNQYFPIVLKVNGNPPRPIWEVTSNVTIRGGRFIGCTNLLQLSGGMIQGNDDTRVSRIDMSHNVFLLPGTYDHQFNTHQPFMIQWGAYSPLAEIHVHHNTIVAADHDQYTHISDDQSNNGLTDFVGCSQEGNVFILPASAQYPSWYNWSRTNGAFGEAGQATDPTRMRQRGNVIARQGTSINGSPRPGDIFFTGDLTTLLDLTTGTLPVNSPLLTLDYDGGKAGADVTLLA